MGYFWQAIKGVSWVGAFRAISRVIAIVKMLVLAKLLTPLQFGLFGIATIILGLLEILTETGINVFLIQYKGNIDEYLDTAWVVSIARGIIISLGIALSSYWVAYFFHNLDAQKLLLLIALVPLIRGFINPSIVKFQKELIFGKDFAYRLTIFTFDAAVALTVAFATRSEVAPIYGLIAGAILEVILSFTLITPAPKLSYEPKKAKEVIHAGKWVTGAGIFDYLFQNIDDIVVGRVLGAGALGLYQFAYSIATLPVSEISDVLGKVTFPIFVKISHDKNRLKRAYLRVTSGIGIIAIPFGLILILFSKFILSIFGPNWVPAAGALQAVTIYAVIKAMINPAMTAFLAVGKQRYVTVVTLVGIVALSIFIYPMVIAQNIYGAGLSTIFAILLSLPFVFYYTRKIFR